MSFFQVQEVNNKKYTGKAVRHRENFATELNLIGQGRHTQVKQAEIQVALFF
jgi:hypothetical protein